MPIKTRNLSGEIFGRLTVHEFAGYIKNSSDTHRLASWWCQCDCGNRKIVKATYIINGATRSCGCYAKDSAVNTARMLGLKNTKNCGPIEARQLYARYKHDALRRGYAFDITYEEAMCLYKMNCTYCGSEPNAINIVRNAMFVYNGIDRMDNNIGYTSGNCVPCCKKCNDVKRNLTLEDFKAWVKRAYTTMFVNDHATV